VANDGNDGNAGIYSRVENTEKDSGDDSGSSGVTSSSVTTVDVVGLQSVHMCYQGDVLRPLGDDEEANSRIVFIGRNLPVDELLEAFSECRVEDRGEGRSEQQGGGDGRSGRGWDGGKAAVKHMITRHSAH
jgi:hypothetical protein